LSALILFAIINIIASVSLLSACAAVIS